MKKGLFFIAFLMIAGISVNAQSHSSCNKPCSSSSEKASVKSTEDVTSKAILVANSDENIEVKTCENSGKVSFYRKDVCDESGKVSYTEVEYSAATESFASKVSNEEKVNVAPSEVKEVKAKSDCSSKATKAKADCSSKASKAGCSKEASATKAGCCSSKASTASLKGKKDACCAPGSAKKSCGAKS